MAVARRCRRDTERRNAGDLGRRLARLKAQAAQRVAEKGRTLGHCSSSPLIPSSRWAGAFCPRGDDGRSRRLLRCSRAPACVLYRRERDHAPKGSRRERLVESGCVQAVVAEEIEIYLDRANGAARGRYAIQGRAAFRRAARGLLFFVVGLPLYETVSCSKVGFPVRLSWLNAA